MGTEHPLVNKTVRITTGTSVTKPVKVTYVGEGLLAFRDSEGETTWIPISGLAAINEVSEKETEAERQAEADPLAPRRL